MLHSGDTIQIINNRIYFDRILISGDIANIDFSNKINSLFEQDDRIYLILSIENQPDKNLISVYGITPTIASLNASLAVNDTLLANSGGQFTDMDNDGYIEFGGRVLSEVHPDADSMYYTPFEFYELKDGIFTEDKALEIRKAIEYNGVYIEKPVDARGNCCIVIAKPKIIDH